MTKEEFLALWQELQECTDPKRRKEINDLLDKHSHEVVEEQKKKAIEEEKQR